MIVIIQIQSYRLVVFMYLYIDYRGMKQILKYVVILNFFIYMFDMVIEK